jgi:hypothetical protein
MASPPFAHNRGSSRQDFGDGQQDGTAFAFHPLSSAFCSEEVAFRFVSWWSRRTDGNRSLVCAKVSSSIVTWWRARQLHLGGQVEIGQQASSNWKSEVLVGVEIHPAGTGRLA